MQSAVFWIGFAISAVWFGWLLRRFQVYWDSGQGRIMDLGQGLRQAERRVADEERRFETLGHQIKQAQSQAEKARREELELRQKKAAVGPSPTTEILITAEFPSSASEVPWVANMVPRGGAPKSQQPVLLWAADYPAALVRSKRLADEMMKGAVNDIRRLTGAGRG